LGQVGGGTAVTPNISHAEVVTRELQRRKPFNPKGGGYRDYLIRRTVLSIAREAPDSTVIFATANTKDFADEGGLHPDLRADLVALEMDVGRLVLHASLEDVLASTVRPLRRRARPLQPSTSSTPPPVLRRWDERDGDDEEVVLGGRCRFTTWS
jgi:hypothetical protein